MVRLEGLAALCSHSSQCQPGHLQSSLVSLGTAPGTHPFGSSFPWHTLQGWSQNSNVVTSLRCVYVCARMLATQEPRKIWERDCETGVVGVSTAMQKSPWTLVQRERSFVLWREAIAERCHYREIRRKERTKNAERGRKKPFRYTGKGKYNQISPNLCSRAWRHSCPRHSCPQMCKQADVSRAVSQESRSHLHPCQLPQKCFCSSSGSF